MAPMGWKAECTDGGQKNRFLGSFGAAQKHGGLVRAVSEDRGSAHQRLLRRVVYRWDTGSKSLDHAGIHGVRGTGQAGCLPFRS